jgi:hypothetical protein
MNNECGKNDSYGKVIYMGNVHGPEKVNDTCVKTVRVGAMDRGFTVLVLAVSFVT